ncbi:MCE family protein [Kutzneria albida]|uniref:Virulence factor Mce family protein n=1 Tax=Kutzneria albida DSM 43870 TaxID=1449976 RepID=W5WG85_9PSEU|nr:MCE family protein [Kutzneria albida]AHH99760.1 hypothetical protein KALB_6400 [Kutzneria albida DSM 43870]
MRRAVVLALAACTLATGCSGGFTGVYDLPLPGGADLGGHPYRITAQFHDVLDLVPQAAVKVNNVAVGRVDTITLPDNGWSAQVGLSVNGDVHLPANAVAWLRQSSLLGEKYVELAAPRDNAQGSLADGAVIPLTRTNRNPQVEEVFGALSLVLNGGGIAQIQDINRELNKAVVGNESQVRSLVGNLNTLVSNLDAHRQDITSALDGVNRLSATLDQRKDQVGGVLDNLTPGMKVLSEQRESLVTMLRSIDHLSGVATDTINRSKDDMVADLKALQPTLNQLAAAGKNLPESLELLVTYPFTDAALDAIKGDYLNVYLSVTAVPGTVVNPPVGPKLLFDGSAR